jgi:hypothetical protein
MDAGFTAFVMVVALLVAVGASLLLVGYFGTLPASFAFGWKNWVPTLLLPVIGPLWFSWRHWSDFSRPGKQLFAGIALILIAILILYKGGPYIIDRMSAGVK